MIEIVKITDVCDFQGGTQPPKNEWKKDLTEGYIRMLQIRDFTQPEKNNIEYILELKKTKKCNKEDILIGRYGASIGKICTGLKGAYNVALIKTIPNLSILDRSYLLYILKSTSFQNFIQNIGSRAAQAGFNKEDLENFQFPLPSLATQKKIAAILDQADQLRQLNKELLQKYDTLSQSLFLDMFGVENTRRKEWKEKKIEDIAENKKGSMRTGPFGSDLLHSEFVKEGISVLGIDNAVLNKFQWKERRYITPEKYEKLKRYTIFPQDVIITIMGTVGRVAVVPEQVGIAINTKHLAAITLNKEVANPEFIAFSLHSDPSILWQIKNKGRGAIMTGLNLTIIKGLKLKLPPITLQNQFAEYAQAIKVQKSNAEQSLKKAEDLFNSLLQKAFNGGLVE